MILHFLQHNMVAAGEPRELVEFIKVLGKTDSEEAEKPDSKGDIFKHFLTT